MASKFWIKVRINGAEQIVRLGDPVWFFPGCNMQSTPLVGTVVSIGDEYMVDLMLASPAIGRRASEDGVGLYGTAPLENKAHRDKGCWLPQTNLEYIKSTPAVEG